MSSMVIYSVKHGYIQCTHTHTCVYFYTNIFSYVSLYKILCHLIVHPSLIVHMSSAIILDDCSCHSSQLFLNLPLLPTARSVTKISFLVKTNLCFLCIMYLAALINVTEQNAATYTHRLDFKT